MEDAPRESTRQGDTDRGRSEAKAAASNEWELGEKGVDRARVDGGEDEAASVYVRVAALVATGALIGVVFMRSRARR